MYLQNTIAFRDLLLKENGAIVKAIQICLHVTDSNERNRLFFKLIMTFDQEDKLDGISLLPAWKWMKEAVTQ